MRHFWSALAGVLLSAALAFAQQPPTQPPAGTQPPPVTLDPAKNPLDAHLLRWEKELKAVQTLLIQCTRTDNLKTFGIVDTFTGEAKYMKLPVGNTGQVENLASLQLQKKDKPEVFERFLCTGTALYQWMPQQKEIRVYQLPPPRPGQVADDNFLSFLFGMRAEEAKRRYDMQLVKEDQHYIYVKILPRFPADKAEFQEARLVLTRDTYLPRQLWFRQGNNDEVTWDMPRIQSGAQIDRKEFVAPQAPAGWKLVPQQARAGASEVPPRVIRQNQ